MSLEQKIDDLTAAIAKLTTTIEGGFTGKATTAASDDKGKDKGDDKEKATGTRATRKPAAEKVPSTADLKKAAEAFLDKAGNDEDNYADRRAHIKDIIAKFDSPKFTEIAEGDRKDALAMLAEFDKEEPAEESRGRGRDNDDI